MAEKIARKARGHSIVLVLDHKIDKAAEIEFRERSSEPAIQSAVVHQNK